MKLYDFETVLTFGQHKGETIAEALKSNPTYLVWCYQNNNDFFITDAVLEKIGVHKTLENNSKNDTMSHEDVSKIKEHNNKLYKEKRTAYKKQMIDLYANKIENNLKGTPYNDNK